MNRFVLCYLAAFSAALLVALPGASSADEPETFLGRLGGNPISADSTANPHGPYGSVHSPTSINNPHGRWGSPHSPQGATNPHTIEGPKIIAPDGQFLGRLNANPHDPDSVANPHGRYGSPHSPLSINNPHGPYGGRFSPTSPNNPHATNPPILVGQ